MERSGGERGMALGFEADLSRGLSPPHPTSFRLWPAAAAHPARSSCSWCSPEEPTSSIGCLPLLAKKNNKAAAFCVVLLPGILEMAATVEDFLNGKQLGFARLQGQC